MLGWVLAGCNWFDDPIVAQALDYVTTEPRVLGVRADPPWFASGTEVTFQALVMGPDGPGETAVLSVCGLDTAVRADIYDVSCFADASQVTELGTVPGLRWTPPALEFDCSDEGTYELGGTCATRVMMLATPGNDGELASFGATIERDEDDVPKALRIVRDAPPSVALDASDEGDGIQLTATVTIGGLGDVLGIDPEDFADPYSLHFRWAVTGGTLDETGRTLLDSADGKTITSVNTWHPEGADAWAAVVIAPALWNEGSPLLWWATVEAP